MQDAYARLGLPPEASAGDIRKAYAGELKQVDQQNDPAGFQTLRDAYESLLSGTIQSDSTRSVRPASQAEEESARLVAHAAWEQCLAAIAQAEKIDTYVWEANLRQSVVSEMLVSLDVRMHFEMIIAHALVYRRYAGHQSLFMAATKIFGWEDERRRLRSFHRAGAVLDLAISQRRLLEELSQQEQAPLRAAIARMSDPRPPELEDVDNHCLAILRLQNLFPALMAITLGNNTFHRWLNAGSDDTLYTPSTDEDEQWKTIAKSKKQAEYRFWRVVMVFMFLAPILLFCCVALSKYFYPTV